MPRCTTPSIIEVLADALADGTEVDVVAFLPFLINLDFDSAKAELIVAAYSDQIEGVSAARVIRSTPLSRR